MNTHFRSKVRFLQKIGKLFPQPVGVFCTILNPPTSRIIQKIIFFRKTAISSNIRFFQYTTVGNPLFALMQWPHVSFVCSDAAGGLHQSYLMQ